jgi:hypothetical protein
MRPANARARTLSPNNSRIFRPRTDELDPFFGRAAGEAGVFAEKAVAGMDSFASGRLRDRHDLFDVEVGGGADAAERAGLIGLAGMEGSGVVLGKDGYRANPKLGGGAHDADCDFASVGDQKTAGKHESAATPPARISLG